MATISVATQIANLALSHCGISKPIQDLAADHSVEAQMCLTWFDTARRKTMVSRVPWSFSTKQVIPALVANYPTSEWNYAYAYPADALKLTRFMSWRLNNDTNGSRVPYRVMQPVSITLSNDPSHPTTEYTQTDGLWIYTNWPGTNPGLPTVLEYIFDNTNIGQWTDSFNEAMSYKLAELIVATLDTGNPQQKKEQIKADYEKSLDQASLENVNEEQRPPEPDAEVIRARTGDMLSAYPGMTWIAEPAGFNVA